MVERRLSYIAGEWVRAGREMEVENPATGAVVAKVVMVGEAEICRAIDAAARAFRVWRNTSPHERAGYVSRISSLTRDRADAIARLMVEEQGKTLAECRGEVFAAAEHFDWLAAEGRRIYGRNINSRIPGLEQDVLYEPCGVVAAFSPWNLPFLMPARKIVTAIVAGCTVVCKPSEETPGSAMAFAEICEEAGLPKGVVNVVFAEPELCSRILLSSPEVRKISFTGSVSVGKKMFEMAATGLKRMTLELGGHAPVIVCDDADIDFVVSQSADFKFKNAGQLCIAPTRYIVQERLYERFVERYIAFARALKVGSGEDPSTQMGPMANARRISAMERILSDAAGKGARIETGGMRIGNQGHFWAPTVLTGASLDSEIMTSEPFGPIAVISPYGTDAAAIEEANRLSYALAAFVYGRNADRCRDLGSAIEAGMVGINSVAIASPEVPFGGMKDSGQGREAGIEGLREHLETKLLTRARHPGGLS